MQPLTLRRIVGCVILVVRPGVCAAIDRIKASRGYRLHTNVQACASCGQARLACEQADEAIEQFSATAFFRAQWRLTALGDARNIVRTRTSCPASEPERDQCYDASLAM